MRQDALYNHLVANLPHGSGIDGVWNYERRTARRGQVSYRVSNSFHLMNDVGFYIGWVEFSFSVYSHFKHIYLGAIEFEAPFVAEIWEYTQNPQDYLDESIYFALEQNGWKVYPDE